MWCGTEWWGTGVETMLYTKIDLRMGVEATNLNVGLKNFMYFNSNFIKCHAKSMIFRAKFHTLAAVIILSECRRMHHFASRNSKFSRTP